jgi:hypothetical protein
MNTRNHCFDISEAYHQNFFSSRDWLVFILETPWEDGLNLSPKLNTCLCSTHALPSFSANVKHCKDGEHDIHPTGFDLAQESDQMAHITPLG